MTGVLTRTLEHHWNMLRLKKLTKKKVTETYALWCNSCVGKKA